MKLHGDAGELAVELIGRMGRDPARPDLNLRVSARVASFSGRVPSLWVERARAEAFTQQLDSLDRELKGEASLEAMSPGDFVLTLAPHGARGHVRVTWQLGAIHYVERGTLDARMTGGFMIEAQQLGEALGWWRAALAAV